MKIIILNLGIILGILSTTKACIRNYEKYLRCPQCTEDGQGGGSQEQQYDSVDCGDTGNFTLAPPYNRSYWRLPQCPDEIRPTYTLHTRSNDNTGMVINYDQWSIPSEFDPSHRTAFVAHGFRNNADMPWVQDIVRLLAAGDFNVITVDWRRGADVGTTSVDRYSSAPSNTRTVGAQTALVMKHLVEIGNASWDSLWCIGHGLGAHVCGLAGMEASIRGEMIGRVTGLDPAGGHFEKSQNLKVGVNPTSAAFVDIIHTTTRLGTRRTLGHMDFYPSDDDFQDGCGTDVTCGHYRSEQYFRESIENDCFLVTETCKNYKNIPSSCSETGRVVAKMGFQAEGQPGIYRPKINTRPPFCQSDEAGPAVDIYKREGYGENVVDEVIKRITAIFGDDKCILKRIAYVESKYGNDKNTYLPKEDKPYPGGIWQVDTSGFGDTKNVVSHPDLKNKYKTIKEEFGIDWEKVTWEDLRKPLYSGLAARLKLLNVKGPIPADLQGQAKYWKDYYNSSDGKGTVEKFVEDVEAEEGEKGGKCPLQPKP